MSDQLTGYTPTPPSDKSTWTQPIDPADEIDEIVNWQLAKGTGW